MQDQPTIAICIAAFNRRESTLACLADLHSSEQTSGLPDGLGLTIYLLDDASTDGTGDAVRERFPDVVLLKGSGSLYWAGGMRVAYGAALRHGHPYYLWMNDDVVAHPGAIATLIDTERQLHAAEGRHHLVSAGMWDPDRGQASYGGYNLVSKFNPSKIAMVLPLPDRPRHCDLTNANMLLIPDAIARDLGNLPKSYTHTLGDWDYGLRAARRGYGTFLAPGYLGDCTGNVSLRQRWFGAGLSLRERYRRMLDPLALPFRPRAYFLFSHFKLVAPLFLFSPYIKMPIDHVLRRLDPAKH